MGHMKNVRSEERGVRRFGMRCAHGFINSRSDLNADRSGFVLFQHKHGDGEYE